MVKQAGSIVAAFLIFASAAQAADTITFNLTNSTGSTIYRNASFTACALSRTMSFRLVNKVEIAC